MLDEKVGHFMKFYNYEIKKVLTLMVVQAGVLYEDIS